MTHGGQLPSEKDPYAKGGSLSNANKVVNDAVKYIMAQAGGGNFTQNAIQQGLMAQLGINLPGRIVPHFGELMEGAATPLSAKEKARAAKVAADATKPGTDKLIESQGFLKSSTDKLTNAFTHYVFNQQTLVHGLASYLPVGMEANLASGLMLDLLKNGARHAKTKK